MIEKIINGIKYCLDEENLTAEVIKGYDGNIIIPETVVFNEVTYRVTSIGQRAFANYDFITSIVIPNGVMSIGKEAFYDSSLTSIVIPNSVMSIGEGAFSCCEFLASIVIGNGVMSIGESAFSGCESLTSMVIPNSVTSIGKGAFAGCFRLTSMVIGNGVMSIGKGAFLDCFHLTSIVIPDSVTSIGKGAFAGCDSLKQDPTQEIEMSNFKYRLLMHNHLAMVLGYSGCSETINIPSEINHKGVIYRVATIGESAFSGCSSLTSMVVAEGNTVYDSREQCNAIIHTATNTLISGCQNTIIPDSVMSIGDCAFLDCSSLTSIVIPNGVMSIGDYAFYNCSSLTSIVIPDGVTSIEEGAFQDCSSLTSITFNGTKAQWNRIELGEDWNDNVPTKVIHCTDGEVEI